MDLEIKVIDRTPKKRDNVVSVLGQIKIGKFDESLYMPLDLWSVHDYEKQWMIGIQRLKDYNASCLIATIHDPFIRPYVDWWLLYRDRDKVFVQNQVLFGEIYKEQIGQKEFNAQTCYNFIPPRHCESQEYAVSEWVIDYP